MPPGAAVLTEHSYVGDKGNMPLHRGRRELGAKPVLSRPSFLPEPMLTYRTEAVLSTTALALEPDAAYPDMSGIVPVSYTFLPINENFNG
ncbi:hypothetical protein GCM10011409_20880 [Lentibacillus populi]|uniref:Uncharacterized protein n=1 Tax=Lentibacillus populi TaxID=1827502 RepID=A0A9W5TY21_9BACI|nr:hypothetical protein GCM10011409_20880 [Lentibacillus populi]